MITSNTTIEAKPFDGLWITSLLLNKGFASITALPYNGTHVLVSPATRSRVELSNELLGNIEAAMQRKASVSAKLIQLIVAAPSPDRPVSIRATFEGFPRAYHIADAYKLAAEDQVFGAAFQTIMYQLGNLIKTEQ